MKWDKKTPFTPSKVKGRIPSLYNLRLNKKSHIINNKHKDKYKIENAKDTNALSLLSSFIKKLKYKI